MNLADFLDIRFDRQLMYGFVHVEPSRQSAAFVAGYGPRRSIWEDYSAVLWAEAVLHEDLCLQTGGAA